MLTLADKVGRGSLANTDITDNNATTKNIYIELIFTYYYCGTNIQKYIFLSVTQGEGVGAYPDKAAETKMCGGCGQLLILADKEGGGLEPRSFLADIICDQHFTTTLPSLSCKVTFRFLHFFLHIYHIKMFQI